jgi:hypothetical protein
MISSRNFSFGVRRCCFRDWIDGFDVSLVEADIHQSLLFGHVVPERIGNRLAPFMNSMVGQFLFGIDFLESIPDSKVESK